ncbi:exonuclease domain-containing protein [Cellulomonas rhizosphaerae]|uniref:3'-5' exonuclease n=1 Tax=Cellulomonas rhizosphaerae TaxID=2293719 RepID=A0A413RJD0_9CELL|nr:exonuclease domain-containing protein [Cellulomonas rhizosphaerae]RHA38689.1 3'-5' exonuclease [Cellulomonas rhizosphaerae]
MGAPWWEGPLVGFDLETTGPDPETALIVTACVVVDIPGGEPVVMNWLVDPGVEIPEGATAVHGITTDHAREHGRPAVAAVSRILEVLRSQPHPLVAFNAAYDFTVLDREARRHGLAPLDPDRVIDPFVLDKKVDQYRRGKRTLARCCEIYGVELLDAHTAEADALAAVHVARAIAREYPGAPEDAAELHRRLVIWRAEQCRSLVHPVRQLAGIGGAA